MSQSIVVEKNPADALFALMARYKADDHPQKCDLGVGAYRTDAGQPWVLPVVRKVDEELAKDPKVNHEYLPIAGNAEFVKAAAKLLLGDDVDLSKVASVQTLSGTGANHMSAVLFRRFGSFGSSTKTLYVSDPTWANHHTIFKFAGLEVKTYPYWDPKTRAIKFNEMVAALKNANKGDCILLHACAHNPTGLDPTQEQWKEIAKVVQDKKLLVLFDSAYQGFASGDLDRDAWAVRYFIKQGIPCMVCQSFAKNMGLYGERCGALHVFDPNATADSTAAVKSQLELQTRAELSNPAAYGARIAAKILTNPEDFAQWKQNITEMSGRIQDMRAVLRGKLESLGTPGKWDHITSQIGMFSFTGLNKQQVDRLVNEFHIYLAGNGRISMAGLNSNNVDYIAKSIDTVVRNSSDNARL